MRLSKYSIFADGRKQIELWQENIIYGLYSKQGIVPQLKEEKNEEDITYINSKFCCT